MEESIPMTLSDFINKLSSVEKDRNQFDVNHCVVPQIVDTFKGTSDLYFGVKDASKPVVIPPFKTYDTPTMNSEQNEQARIQLFTYRFPELFNAEHPKSSNNLARLRNHEVSVRLASVTTELLSALYFACRSDNSDTDSNPEDKAAKTPASSCAVYLLRFDEKLSCHWHHPYFQEMMNLAFEPQGLSIDLAQTRFPFVFHVLGNDKEDQNAWDRLSSPRLILPDETPNFTKRETAPLEHFVFFPPLFEVVSIDGKKCLDQVPLFGKTPNGRRTADDYNHQLTTSFKVEIPSGSKAAICKELEQLAGLTQPTLFPEDIDSAMKNH